MFVNNAYSKTAVCRLNALKDLLRSLFWSKLILSVSFAIIMV